MSEVCYEPATAAGEYDDCVMISGCSGGGKSSLLAALARSNFAVFEEPGRQIVKEQLFIGGDALPWTNPAAFVELCVSRAMHQRIAAQRIVARRIAARRAEQWTFFDRGIVDALSFLEHLGQPVPAHLEAAAQRLRYAQTVFMTPPWPEIFTTDAQRRHGFDEAVAQYESLRRTYQRLGYCLVELPKTSIEQRLCYLLEHLPALCV